MDFREIRWDGMDWIVLAQDKSSCEHGNEPSGSINCGKFLSNSTAGGFSRRAQLHGVIIISYGVICNNYSACERWYKINSDKFNSIGRVTNISLIVFHS
jgi:hypothetical protein